MKSLQSLSSVAGVFAACILFAADGVFAQVDPTASAQINAQQAASASSWNSSPLLSQPAPIGDCNDNNPNIHPGAVEVVGNGIDDNCNGLADEAPDGSPSSDTSDTDGDGFTVAVGDCNDHNVAVRPGAAEVVGDRIDNNCNGIADEDALGNPSTDTVDHDGDGLPMSNDRIFFGAFES